MIITARAKASLEAKIAEAYKDLLVARQSKQTMLADLAQGRLNTLLDEYMEEVVK